MPRDVSTLPPIPADQRVVYGADPSQFFDLFLPLSSSGTKPRAFAAMIHGGFWRAKYDLTHASHLCAALAAAGLATANLEYRRVGNGGGWPVTFHDVRAAVSAAAAHFGAAPVLLGHSAGGHLALRLAAEVLPLAGVIALAPVADLQLAYALHLSNDAVAEFLGGTPADKPQAYAAADAALHASTIPRVLLHGTHDDVVPLSLSQSFVEKRRADAGGVELHELPNATHMDLIDPQAAAWPTVIGAVERLLAGNR